MEQVDWRAQRESAIHLLRSGHSVQEVSKEMNRPASWVYKWKGRYERESWAGLADRSRAPDRVANKVPEEMRQAICQARSELEAKAARGEGLGYIGAPAILEQLQGKERVSLPSTATVERVLHDAEMTRPYRSKSERKDHYPHLHPTEPHQLCQVDIVPHFLTGGQAIACFNSIDVVSRYPSGHQSLRRRSLDAAQGLIHIWQAQGIPQYTQVDNEACFSGGFTHKGVLGRVVRLALSVGTELVFSPVRHPESNGYVERFHQDYDRCVWDKTRLTDLADIQRHSHRFYRAYRQSHHHSALQGCCPAQIHARCAMHKLSADFQVPKGKQPLTEGRIHFMRKVSAQQTVSILNLDWDVPQSEPDQGVWATLEFKRQGATLRIYDAAPDATHRICLAKHSFPLKEQVHPLRPEFLRRTARRSVKQWISNMSHSLVAQVKRRFPFHDVLMARLLVKVPRSYTMS